MSLTVMHIWIDNSNKGRVITASNSIIHNDIIKIGLVGSSTKGIGGQPATIVQNGPISGENSI